MRHLRAYINQQTKLSQFMNERAKLLSLHENTDYGNKYKYSALENAVDDFIKRWGLPISYNDVRRYKPYYAVFTEQIRFIKATVSYPNYDISTDFIGTFYSSGDKIFIYKRNICVELLDEGKFRYTIRYGSAITYSDGVLQMGCYTFTTNPASATKYSFVGCHFTFILTGRLGFTYHLCTNTLSCYYDGLKPDISTCCRWGASYLYAVRKKIIEKTKQFKARNIDKLNTAMDRIIEKDFL